MRRLLLLPALAAVVAATGCGLTDTGPRTTEDRSVDAFSRIDDDHGLAARDARVKVGGSGDVDVAAGQTLDVTVDGSGDVSYRGNPSPTQHIDGSGDIDHGG